MNTKASTIKATLSQQVEAKLNSQPTWAWLVLVFGINIILKGLFLGIPDFGMDEPFTLFRAQQTYPELIQLLANNNHPPLFESLMWLWLRIGGYDVVWLRIIPLVFSSLTACAIFYWLKRASGSSHLALVAALLFTFSNQFIYFSHEIRSYPLFSFLTVLVILLFENLLNSASRKNILWLGVVNAILLYTHYFGAFVVVVQVLYVLGWKRSHFKWLVISGLISIVIYLPQVYMTLNRVVAKVESGHWLAEPGIGNLFNLLKKFTNSPVISIILLLIVIVGLIMGWKSASTRMKQSIRIQLLLFPGVYLAMFFASSQFPMFHDRYVSYSVVFLFTLVASAIAVIPHKKVKILLGMLTLLPMLISTNLKPEHGMAYAQVIEEIEPYRTPNSIIISAPIATYIQLGYYLNFEHFKDYKNTLKLFEQDGVIFQQKPTIQTINPYIKKANRVILLLNEHDVEPLKPSIKRHWKIMAEKRIKQTGILVVDKE
ncbi:MAG: glycosyltransferase family 39 protein [Bacteroidetes bacterium]|nr:glycosyltransferase family 39 protein [Bacteroidota bacterium]